jgi:hypothetical protein
LSSLRLLSFSELIGGCADSGSRITPQEQPPKCDQLVPGRATPGGIDDNRDGNGNNHGQP